MSAPLSRGIFATSFVHVDEKVTDASRSSRSTPRRTRRSRSCASRRSVSPRSSAVQRDELLPRSGVQVGPVEDGKRVVACFSRDRQPHQGGRGAGDPVDEPDARAATSGRRWRTRGAGRESERLRRPQARRARSSRPSAGARHRRGRRGEARAAGLRASSSSTAEGRRRPISRSGSGRAEDRRRASHHG